jgi:membrane-associated phospholipid phosphatase
MSKRKTAILKKSYGFDHKSKKWRTAFERLFTTMANPWVMLFMVVLNVLLYFFVDKPLTFFMKTQQWMVKYPLLDILTQLGAGWFYMICLALLACVFRFILHNERWAHRTWFLWLCVLVPNLICLVLKILLGRARPDIFISSNLYGFYGLQKTAIYWSLPSGHTTTIMGLLLGCGALFPRYLWGFICFGGLISALRIVLLKHYLSDVMVASYLALIEVGLLYHWLESYVSDNKKQGISA